METINLTEIRQAKMLLEQEITDALVKFSKSTQQVVESISIVNQKYGEGAQHFIRCGCKVQIDI